MVLSGTTTGGDIDTMAIGDVDDDGLEDIIVSGITGKAGIYFQGEQGKLELQVLPGEINLADDRAAIGDIDGNGLPDIVLLGEG